MVPVDREKRSRLRIRLGDGVQQRRISPRRALKTQYMDMESHRMKVYRDKLRNAASKAEMSIRFVGSDVGEWSYPTPHAVDDWDKAGTVIDQLIERSWLV